MKNFRTTSLSLAFFLVASGSMALAQEGGQSNPSGLGDSYVIEGIGSGGCCGRYYDYANADGNATAVVKNFNQKLAAMQLAIIEAMRLSTGQVSGNLREQTGATHTLADQQDDRSTVKAIEAHTLEALNEAVSGTTSCQVITGSRGGGMTAATRQVQQSFSTELQTWMEGGSPLSSEGQDTAVLNRLEMHCGKWATEADVESGLCPAVGQIPGADVQVSESLYYSNGVVNGYDEERSLAAQAYIMNVASPVPFAPLSEVEAGTAEGRLRAQYQKVQLARGSLAEADLSRHWAQRNIISTNNDLEGWAQENASEMQGYADADFSEGLSYHDWLAINSRGFLLNSKALAASDENSVTAIKDMKNMMAVQNYQNFENYIVLEKILANLATQTAMMNEMMRTDVNFSVATSQGN